MVLPWRPIITVTALTVFGVVALALGHVELAALAGGALAGYLGKVNGAASQGSTSGPGP